MESTIVLKKKYTYNFKLNILLSHSPLADALIEIFRKKIF